MRAIQYTEFGGHEQLRLVELPGPTPGDGQSLIQRAADAQRHLIDDRPYGRVVLAL